MAPHTDDARDILTFYIDAGVDVVIGDDPVNRLEGPFSAFRDMSLPATQSISQQIALEEGSGGEAAQNVAAQPRNAGLGGSLPLGSPPVLPSPDEAVMAAREAVRSAATLDDLRAILNRFDGCTLKSTATQLVFADGNSSSRLMLVGEGPGRDEDLAGVPFVGRSGKLLDQMLGAIGLDRSQVYIANIVPWRPPGNRTPTPQEIAICLPFIVRQIELADPDILVCLGKPSMTALLGTDEGIRKMRGRWFTYRLGPREIRALPTFHPAYLLRSPLEKRLAWRDFLAIKAALGAS